jgi:hypothetical protein
VTTGGGGALPLPTKQPAKLSEATTNATATASFFKAASRFYAKINARTNPALQVQKSHTPQLI